MNAMVTNKLNTQKYPELGNRSFQEARTLCDNQGILRLGNSIQGSDMAKRDKAQSAMDNGNQYDSW
jgi:hypothetical protein